MIYHVLKRSLVKVHVYMRNNEDLNHIQDR